MALFMVACASTETSPSEPQIINVYASASTRPWTTEIYACTPVGAVVRVVNDPTSADISLRLGEPEFLSGYIYQIDSEEILVVTHRQSPVQNLTMGEVRELFSGQGDPSVQVWVYASGEDVQRVFEQAVMEGRSATSLARLATSPQHMSDVLVNEINSAGILPYHWKMGDVRDVFTISDIPVLAILTSEPQSATQEVLSCLQK